ncbi:hypothetical protein ACVWXQ_007443 [Bradyrhizobium sp. S3.14.4]
MGNPDSWVLRRMDGAAKAGAGQVQRGNTWPRVDPNLAAGGASVLFMDLPAP